MKKILSKIPGILLITTIVIISMIVSKMLLLQEIIISSAFISILIGLFVVLVLGINLWPTHNYPSGHKFENLIVFGDSLSDSSPMGYCVTV